MSNNSQKLKVVFMGTPEIAVASLKAILNAGYNVAGVVTAPDRPAGRGRKIKYSPVKEFALSHSLKIMQPANLKDEGFINELKAINPDVQVVVAFRMLPESVWKIPPLGTFNMHASLLPDLRGAAPINWAVIYGYKKTGVTTFFINEEIDKGKIILREEVDIEENETAGTLHDKLMMKGAKLVVDTLYAIGNKTADPTCQSCFEKHETQLKPAPKIYKADCKINWEKSTVDICNLIHGLNPVPGAFAELEINERIAGANYKILNAKPVIENHNEIPGTVFTDEKNVLKIAAKDGFVVILSIQEPGKRLLKTSEYLRGAKISKKVKKI